jgi:hypothetical protein
MQLTTLPSRFPELQAELDAYLAYYNRRRPHMALGGLAPLEFLAKMQEESVPPKGPCLVVSRCMCKRLCTGGIPLLKHLL